MRFLVIGAGGAGGIHARELTQRGHDVSVHDLNAEKAKQLAGSCGARVAANSEDECDCVVVAVPANAHASVASAQIAAGRGAVVCEKPLCLHDDDARGLVKLAEEEDVRLLIAESQCYSGEDGLGVLQMRDRIRDGHFGHPVMWRVCAMTSYRPQAWCNDIAIGGGAFLEGGVHILTTARVLFGEAVSWQASVRCFSGGTAPDSGTFVIDYEDGHQLTLQIGWGTAGCFTKECAPLPNSFGLFGPERCEAWWPRDSHGLMWDHLLTCITDGVEPVATVEHAAGAVLDVWQCYRAAGVAQ